MRESLNTFEDMTRSQYGQPEQVIMKPGDRTHLDSEYGGVGLDLGDQREEERNGRSGPGPTPFYLDTS